MQTIGEKIKHLRKINNVSQEELAFTVGVSRQTVSRWELGKSRPTRENIISLCHYFGVSYDYFLPDEVAATEETAADVAPAAALPHKKSTLKTAAILLAIALAITLVVIGLVVGCVYLFFAFTVESSQTSIVRWAVDWGGLIFVCILLYLVVLSIVYLAYRIRNRQKISKCKTKFKKCKPNVADI